MTPADLDDLARCYPTRPVGGGNPYQACVMCGKTDPQISVDFARKNAGHWDECRFGQAISILRGGPGDREACAAEIADAIRYRHEGGVLWNLLEALSPQGAERLREEI